MLTRKLSLCVIAVDWSGYPSQEYHVLRASLLCDGRSLPLLSWVVPSEKQQNGQIQKAFLDALAGAVNPTARVIIVTDAGFQNARVPAYPVARMGFYWPCQGNIQMRLNRKGEYWFRRQELQASSKPEYLGPGTLARAEYARCEGHFTCTGKNQKAGNTGTQGVV